MTYLNVNVSELPQLKEDFERLGLEKFIERYTKYYTISGSPESVQFIEEKFEEYKKIKK